MVLNEQVALDGQVAPTLKATEVVNPKSEPTLIVEVLELPCVTGKEVGLAAIEKSDTVTAKVVVWLRTPSLPFTVIV